MRILILGGTAFLSAEIARQAVAAGHQVTCLARGSAAEPPGGVRWLKADRSLGANSYADASGDWDAVVEVARDAELARDALASLAGPAAHWTFVSSCSVYADHSTPGADEDAALLPPLPAGSASTPENYGESKSAIEQDTLEAAAGKAHLCRPGLIGGPGDGSDRYGYWPARFARDNEPALVPDIASHATQVIDVRDLAAWIIDAAARGITGALNAVGEQVPFGEYVAASRSVAGYQGEVLTAPEGWLRTTGSITGPARIPCLCGCRRSMMASAAAATRRPPLPDSPCGAGRKPSATRSTTNAAAVCAATARPGLRPPPKPGWPRNCWPRNCGGDPEGSATCRMFQTANLPP